MNVLSLFDGISCGQVALERAGIRVDNYFSSEIDENAIKVTQKNYPKTIQIGNVKDLNLNTLPKIDLLLAGSPCQGFSYAGNRLNFEDHRSKLFFYFHKILLNLQEMNPSLLFLLENVKMKPEFSSIITSYLNINPVEINSALVSAQNRKRLYWSNLLISQPEDKKILLSSVIKDQFDGIWVWPRGYNVGGLQSYKGKCPTITTSSWQYNFLLFKKNNPTALYKELDPKFNLKGFVRKFTANEAEELQTLPQNYTSLLKDTQRFKVIGNCWTVDVIAHILSKIKEQ